MEDEEEIEREKRRKTREPAADTDESPNEESEPQTSRCETKKNKYIQKRNITEKTIEATIMVCLCFIFLLQFVST